MQGKTGINREKAGTPVGGGVSQIPQKSVINHRYRLFGIYRELLPRVLLIRWSAVRIRHGLPLFVWIQQLSRLVRLFC